MAALAAQRDTVSVVDDQRGQPTTTADLARFIGDLLATAAPAGIYHGTCEGETTWFGFTQAIFAELGLDPGRVLPTTSAAFVRPAPRPAYSVLAHGRTQAVGVALLPHWREALAAVTSADMSDAAFPFRSAQEIDETFVPGNEPWHVSWALQITAEDRGLADD